MSNPMYPDAYDRAIVRNIRNNAHTTWTRTHEDWLEIENYLDWAYETLGNDSFLWKMADSLSQYGKLTEKQTQAVRDSLARSKARKAERAAALEAQKKLDRDNSGYVGELKQRLVFKHLECVHVTGWETDYGFTFLYVCSDEQQNKIIMKVTTDQGIEKGDIFDVKATVVEHSERDGVKQTRINRPANLEILQAA